MENKIYLIYSKPDFSEIDSTINEIKRSFSKYDIDILIEEQQVKFKDNLGNYYDKIGVAHFVIMLITDNFLKDSICMNIVYKLTLFHDFMERAFPIIFPSAKIYDAVDYIEYLRFWESKKAIMEEKIRELKSFEHINSIMHDVNNFSNIRKIINNFIAEISNMFMISIYDLQTYNFKKLTDTIKSEII